MLSLFTKITGLLNRRLYGLILLGKAMFGGHPCYPLIRREERWCYIVVGVAE